MRQSSQSQSNLIQPSSRLLSPTMTQIDIEPTSPQSRTSPERIQLDRINTSIDETLAQLETTSQHVMHTLAHVMGIKWYQKSTQHKNIMTYQRWREIQQQLSKLTYTCGGIDEALMRHLFSLDAIMGDDTIRTLRRTSVHRIKHAITRVEILTKYMYKVQYWWKKWIKHEPEEQQKQQQQEEPAPMEPATPTPTQATSASASPVLKSTKLPSKSPQASSRTIPSSPQLTKAAKAKKSLQKQTKSPALRPTSANTPTRSPASISRGISSASPSPLLPKRHISIPTQPVRPPPSSPRFHVQTTSAGLVITATLPDVQRSSLDITVRGHLLRIAGVSQGEPFLREMELPENADVDRLDAAWKQDADVLTIEVPLIRKPQPRHTYQDQDQDDEDDMDVDQYHAHPYYYQQPSPYRCAPSYARPSYPRRPVYTAPRSMFGSPFGFW